MTSRLVRGPVCLVMAVVMLTAPVLPLCRPAWAAQAAPGQPDAVLGAMPWREEAQRLERQRYQECRSESVKRAYRFSAQVAELGYSLRPNLAMHVDLAVHVRISDLQAVDGKTIDPS